MFFAATVILIRCVESIVGQIRSLIATQLHFKKEKLYHSAHQETSLCNYQTFDMYVVMNPARFTSTETHFVPQNQVG